MGTGDQNAGERGGGLPCNGLASHPGRSRNIPIPGQSLRFQVAGHMELVGRVPT